MTIQIKREGKGFIFSKYESGNHLETSSTKASMIAGIELRKTIETFQRKLVIDIENVGTIALSKPTIEAGHNVTFNIQVKSKNNESFSCVDCQVGTLVNALELYINRDSKEDFLDFLTQSKGFEPN